MYIPTFLALTLPFLLSCQAFETYDSCATTCFYQMITAFASQCTETVASQAWIACVCQDSDYTYASAGCIAQSCGTAILNDTATKHVYNCNLNGSPPSVDAAQFEAAGEGSATAADAATKSLSIAAETATSASYSILTYSDSGGSTQTTTKSSAQETTQTSSSPATSSSSSSNSGSDTLSTGALVGSIVGSITGAIGSFAGVYFGYKTYKMKKEEKKSKDSEGQGQAVGD